MTLQVRILAPVLARSIQCRPQALSSVVPQQAATAQYVCRQRRELVVVSPLLEGQRPTPSPQRHNSLQGADAMVVARRGAHTVRVIIQKDVEGGGGGSGGGGGGTCYAGDVLRVRAGYARNFLLPHKYAVYATRHNFRRLGMKDPDHETVEERRARLEREALEGSDKDLKARDVLTKYLRNKTLKIWRNVDPETNRVFPGMVDARAVRRKLSRQLKIDLEPHERVHLVAEPVESVAELGDDEIESLMAEKLGAPEKACDVQIRQLGDFLARISLSGGYSVPLRFEVVKR